MALSVMNCNIEGDNHLDRVTRFIKQHQPEIVCLQEVFEDDLELLRTACGAQSWHFIPTIIVSEPAFNLAARGVQGVAILSRLSEEQSSFSSQYYNGGLPLKKLTGPGDAARGVIVGEFDTPEGLYRVATTHFTWSPEGKTSQQQLDDFVELEKILDRYPDLIICADFNAPRGKEVWGKLAARYLDTVPPEITTTITPLHRVTRETGITIELVVDGMFASPVYKSLDTQVFMDLSDHAGLLARFQRAHSASLQIPVLSDRDLLQLTAEQHL